MKERTSLGVRLFFVIVFEKTGRAMVSGCVFPVTVAVTVLCLSTLPDPVHSRVEWPVFFEHLGFVHSIHNKWDLTPKVQFYLPSLEARLSKTLHRLQLLRGHEDEAEHEHEEAHAEASKRSQRPSKLQQLQESWQTLNRYFYTHFKPQNGSSLKKKCAKKKLPALE